MRMWHNEIYEERRPCQYNVVVLPAVEGDFVTLHIAMKNVYEKK